MRESWVPLRTAIMMGVDKESAFEIFSGLTRMGLGGKLGSGCQVGCWTWASIQIPRMGTGGAGLG